MFDVTNCSFIYLVYFGVVWERRINVSFISLCWLKRRSPCNQNSLNARHWLLCLAADLIGNMCWGLGETQSCWRNIPITNSICYGVCSVQFSSVAKSCSNLCNPMDCSMPGLPVLHQLLELVQTHVHRVSDAIQPSHPLSYSSPPAFNLSQ